MRDGQGRGYEPRQESAAAALRAGVGLRRGEAGDRAVVLDISVRPATRRVTRQTTNSLRNHATNGKASGDSTTSVF